MVNCEALKRWVKTLSAGNICSVDIGGKQFEVDSKSKEVLEVQIKLFSCLIENMKPEDDWRSFRGALSPLFYNAFFRVNNSAIRLANYYECLVTPSNIKTYKKIINGLDYQEIGSIRIYDGKTVIGEIGTKSDLIWSVFYDYFINEDEFGSIEHTIHDQESYMSIQLYDMEKLSNDDISQTINEILVKVSMEHDFDFSIVKMDSNYKQKGEAKIYEAQFHSVEFEHIPTLYFSNALHTEDTRLAYLSYYQVIEYFFVRAQNYCFLKDYAALSIPPVDHNELRKILQKYKNSLGERKSLELVLKQGLAMTNFKAWLSRDEGRAKKYCDSSTNSIDLSKSDEKIISNLTERIYSTRCAIAHSKGDTEEYVAIPSISDEKIHREIELIKYVSYEVLKTCSE